MGQQQNTLIHKGAKSGFLSKLNLYCLTREEAKKTKYGDKVPLFQLLTPFQYKSELLGGVIEVPSEPHPFITDLGSIPWFLWSAFMSPDDYDISYPSIVHDYIYDQLGKLDGQADANLKKRVNRKMADEVLREAMASVGASVIKRNMVYDAVRAFGPKW